MKIAIACDHAGYELKAAVARQLTAAGHELLDFGTNSEESVDFVDHVYPAALAVSERRADRAILIDGAGYPSGIVANFLPGVYAAVANDLFSARLSREHTNSNVLCLGGKVVGAGVAAEIVTVWLTTDFLGGKYAKRVEKVEKLAKKHRVGAEATARKVVTVQDIRDALLKRESLLMSDTTILTPSVLDLIR
ncbi:MAG: RpiB/LacA/LacB family sugar-phosphate isomerase [Candidatus Sumerlaeaceae bacterium]